MSGSVFDAVVLLAADGLVAAGRVLGGLRRRCDTERRADAVDALNALEDSQDGLEPGQLSWSPDAGVKDDPPPRWSCAECGRRMNTTAAAASTTKRGLFCSARCASDDPESEVERLNRESIDAWNDARWCYAHNEVWMVCKHRETVCRLEGDPQVRSAAVTVPAADNTTDCDHDCGCARLLRNPETLRRLLDAVNEDESVEVLLEEDTAAVDGTQLTDGLEAAWHYHKAAVGYSSSAHDGVLWMCEGCSWHGRTEQAHARHRFQVLADMSAATGRVNEQLGGTL